MLPNLVVLQVKSRQIDQIWGCGMDEPLKKPILEYLNLTGMNLVKGLEAIQNELAALNSTLQELNTTLKGKR